MRACAYVIGSPDGPGAALMDMARGIGFEIVLPYTSLSAVEMQAAQTPLCFFVFAAVEDVLSLRARAEPIRFCNVRRLRFSPLIYFAESPSVETIRQCINMGFDDVITLPFTQARMEERLARLVGQPVTYYETPGYFGPDRRNRIEDQLRPFEMRGHGQYRRIELIRHPMTGISILRDDHFVAA